MVSRMRARRPSNVWMSKQQTARPHAGKQACLIGKVHVPLVLSVHTREPLRECGIIRHGSATEGLSHALQPAHGTILAACLDSLRNIPPLQARHLRPIAAGSAVDVLHTAEICTVLRLRLLLAEGKGRGSRLANTRVH